MTAQKLITVGENENTVFRSCKDGIHTNVFETICAFLNTRGGTLLLGVDESGEVYGFKERAIPDIIQALKMATQRNRKYPCRTKRRADKTLCAETGDLHRTQNLSVYAGKRSFRQSDREGKSTAADEKRRASVWQAGKSCPFKRNESFRYQL